MKFFVTRTSGRYSDKTPPCPEAVKGEGWDWFVEMQTLDDLKAFVRRHECVVIDEYRDELQIEIYDTYRE